MQNKHKKLLLLLPLLVLLNFALFWNGELPLKLTAKLPLIALQILAGGYAYLQKETLRGYRKHWLALLLLSLYMGFASFGDSLFVFGELFRFSLKNALLYVLACLWSAPILLALLALLERFSLLHKSAVIPSRKQKIILFAGIVLLQALVAYAFYPGGIAVDTYGLIQIARSGSLPSDAHPIVYTLLVRFLLSIVDRVEFLYLVQNLLYTGLLYALFSEGLPKVKLPILLGLAAFFTLFPPYALFSVGIVKDTPFTFALLYITVLSHRAIKNPTIFKKPVFFIKYLITLFFVLTLRHNGAFPYVAILLALLVFAWQHREVCKPVLLCAVLSVTLLLGYRGPLYQINNIPDSNYSPLITLYCGIGSYINHQGEITEEQKAKLEQVMPIEIWRSHYSRYSGHNAYVFLARDGKYFNTNEISDADILKLYVQFFLKRPDILLKDRLDGSSILWCLPRHYDFKIQISHEATIAPPGAAYLNIDTGQMYKDQRGDFYSPRLFVPKYVELAEMENPIIAIWFRGGLFVLLFLVLGLYVRKNRLPGFGFASAALVGNLIGCMFWLYCQETRYVFFLNLITPALIYLVLLGDRKGKSHE